MVKLNDDIDHNLDLIFDAKDQSLTLNKFESKFDNSVNDIVSVMEDQYLIEKSDSDDEIYMLTEKGYEIVEQGGWLYRVDQIENPKESNNLLEKVLYEYDKVVDKSNSSKKFYQKIKLSTYLYLLVLAFFAGLYQYNNSIENKTIEGESVINPKIKQKALIEIKDSIN